MSDAQAKTRSNSKQPSTELASSMLLQGKRYAWIRHGAEVYLLQLTKSNKLLLTK